MARCLRRPRGRLDGAQPPGRREGHRRAGRAAAVLFDRGAAATARGARREARRALSRSARPGLLLQLRGGSQRERPAPGPPPHRTADDRVAAGRLARAHGGDAGLHRRPTLRGGGPARRHAAQPEGPVRRRGGARRGDRRRRRRGAGRAGAGLRRRARLLARVPRSRPAGCATSAGRCCCSTRCSAGSAAAAGSARRRRSA